MPYSKEQLNYFRTIYIVMTIFSAALRKLFKKVWRRLSGSTLRDTTFDGRQFFLKESVLNRQRNREALKTVVKGDSSQFDNSILFYCVLYSDSVGAELWNRHRWMYDEIDKLRVLRNGVCHIAPEAEVNDRDFQTFCTEAISCFRNLHLSTSGLKSVARENSFDTEELAKLKAKLFREQKAIQDYEKYFSNKFSKLKDFREKFNPKPYLEKMKENGILTVDETEDIKRQKNGDIELAILMDSIVYKGPDAISAFFKLLNEADPALASSFVDYLAPSKQLEKIRSPSPERTEHSTCKYPKHYKLVVQTFTDDIYKRDWESLKRRSTLFLHYFQDWSMKLFVQIELAYGYNIQGKGKKATRLLNDTIANAWRAGGDCPRILARALARKSLQFLYAEDYTSSKALAEEASIMISKMECPEEQIVCKKRIADCILYEKDTIEKKKEKLTPLWNTIIDMCQENMTRVPRSSFYLRFVFTDKARLHLGFSKSGFQPASLSDLEEAERCIQRLEEPDLKVDSGDTYTDAFRLICKSKIAFDRSKLAKADEESGGRKTEALCHYNEAARVCQSAHNDGVLFMLSSLKEYLDNGHNYKNYFVL